MSERRRHGPLVQLAAIVLSPIAEKNPVKALSSLAPIVLSMSRITVLVFTIVDASRLATAEMIGWPEVTLAIALVFALPVLAALNKVSASEVVAFGGKILERFGVGAVAQPPYPSMDQDERDDEPDTRVRNAWV